MNKETEQLVNQIHEHYSKEQALKKQIDNLEGRLLDCKLNAVILVALVTTWWFRGLRDILTNSTIGGLTIGFVLIQAMYFTENGYSRKCRIFFSWLLFVYFTVTTAFELYVGQRPIAMVTYFIMSGFSFILVYILYQAYSLPKTAN